MCDAFLFNLNKCESMTELQRIETIITNYTATEYADMMIQREKENFSLTVLDTNTNTIKQVDCDYYEYMRQMWHWEENPPLEKCIENSYISKLQDYAELTSTYAGFIKNGRLFVLNKKEKFVSFLYNTTKDSARLSAKPKNIELKTNYNPNKVDCISETLKASYFDKLIQNGDFIVSKDGKELNELCDKL